MNLIADFRPPLLAVRDNVLRFDVYARRVQVGRSIIALGGLLTLSFTSWLSTVT